MAIISSIRRLKKVNPWKTVYFNFHYFPFKTAVRMPFFICWRTKLYKMRGRVVIDAPVRTGMVEFGYHSLGTQDSFYSRTIWDVVGTLVVRGKANIGRGSKVSIGKEAVMTFGDCFKITGNSELVCHKEITFGDQCLLSWEILVMDTDFHHVFDGNGNVINEPRPVSIGNHVWIGCRNTIMKGVVIGDDNIVSANSTITRSFTDSHCIIGGHGKALEVIRRDVSWKA